MSKINDQRFFALTRYGGAPRVVVYASAPGVAYAEAEAAALEQLRSLTAQDNLTLDELASMTAALEVIPERKASTRYPRAMREYYRLEQALAEEEEEV